MCIRAWQCTLTMTRVYLIYGDRDEVFTSARIRGDAFNDTCTKTFVFLGTSSDLHLKLSSRQIREKIKHHRFYKK